jgi:hypothetical protein
MKKHFFIWGVFTLIMTNVMLAGKGGNLAVFNGTSETWTRGGQPYYQVDEWFFPDTIPPGGFVTKYFEFKEGLNINNDNTGAQVWYFLPSGGTIKIECGYTFVNVHLTGFNNLYNPLKTTLYLGFRWNAYVHFGLYEIDGLIYTDQADMQNWMNDSYTSIAEKRLIDICIPGSHDAGMYFDNGGTRYAAECNTLTQDKSIWNQLLLGTRFFDIRPVMSGGIFKTGHYGNIGGVTCQGKSGESIAEIINNINGFTEIGGTRELIILCLSHSSDADGPENNGKFNPFDITKWNQLFNQLSAINNC